MHRFLVAFLVVFSVGAHALAKCRLDLPIPVVHADLLKNGLRLREAKFDREPRFPSEGTYNPKSDILDLNVFNIEWNYEPSSYLGASLHVRGKGPQSIGFAGTYVGNFQVEGSTTSLGDTTIYFTKHSAHFTGAPHAKPLALTILRMQVKNNRLISLELVLPVYKTWTTAKGEEIAAYTGVQDTLCLKSAK